MSNRLIGRILAYLSTPVLIAREGMLAWLPEGMIDHELTFRRVICGED